MSARKPPQTRQAPTQQTIILPLATTAAGYAPVHYYYHPSHQLRSYYPHYEPRMYHGPTTACEYGGGSEYYPVESDSVTHAGYYQPWQHYLPTARTADLYGAHPPEILKPLYGQYHDGGTYTDLGRNMWDCAFGSAAVGASISGLVGGYRMMSKNAAAAAAAPSVDGGGGGTARG